MLLNWSSEFRKQVIEKKYETINLTLNEKALTENLKAIIQERDTHDDVLIYLTVISSIVLIQSKKEAPLATEENFEEFI